MKLGRTWIALLGAFLGAIGMMAAPLPLELTDPISGWKLATVQRPAAVDLNHELVVHHPKSLERIVVFTSTRPEEAVAVPIAFAHRLRDAFTSFQVGSFAERESDQMGFHGHESGFNVADVSGVLHCRLFAFTVDGTAWGVLVAGPENESTGVRGGFNVLRRRAGGSAPPVLDPYQVKSDPVTSFPISVEISRDRQTRRVTAVIITQVLDDPSGESAMVRVGDRVTRIDGRKIEEFDDGLGIDSQLGRIFLKRRPGDRVALELIEGDTHKPYSVILHSSAPNPMDRFRMR